MLDNCKNTTRQPREEYAPYELWCDESTDILSDYYIIIIITYGLRKHEVQCWLTNTNDIRIATFKTSDLSSIILLNFSATNDY